MALSPDELIDIAPEAIDLVKAISEALKKDADGKVRVTREEARVIRAKVFKLAVEVAQHAID
jgi:hypothetical protein